MKHVKLFENFNDDNLIDELVKELKSQKIKHEVVKSTDANIEDDIVKLENSKFYFQITVGDKTPYMLWHDFEMINEYSTAKVAVEMYLLEKKHHIFLESKKYNGNDMTDEDAFLWFKSLPEDKADKIAKGKSENTDKMIAQILNKHADEIAAWKTLNQ